MTINSNLSAALALEWAEAEQASAHNYATEPALAPEPVLTREPVLAREAERASEPLPIPEPLPTVAPLRTSPLEIASQLEEKVVPKSGWRKWVHRSTGGAINPGESASARRTRELAERIRQPLDGDFRIAIMSVKGGVGKTSTAIGLGSTFARMRGDRVIAVDANPDFGTLAGRVHQPNPATVRDLLEAPSTNRYAEVRAYTSQSNARLEILASDRDPHLSEAFSDENYQATMDILRKHYNIILTDCGTGIVHSAMNEILAQADCLVLVTTPALDGTQSAWATLDWLSAHGYTRLVSSTVVVVNQLTESGLDAASLEELFRQRCRAVCVVPHDPHIARGADIDMDKLHKSTSSAYQHLAAMIADEFAPQRGRHSSAARN